MNLLKQISKYSYRGLSTTSNRQVSSLTKLKKLQSDFQAEDGRPVWLKAGLRNRVLFATTVIACYTGFLMSLAAIYDNAKPTSWKKTKTC